MNWMWNSRSNINIPYINRQYIGGSYSFSNRHLNVCYFSNGSFYELANPSCLWISGTEIVIVLCVFFLCKICQCTLACTADSFRYSRYVYEPWCRVYSFENCVLRNFDHAWGKVYNKSWIFLEGSDTNLEFNTWPLPK